MTSLRSIQIVREILDMLDIQYRSVTYGEIDIYRILAPNQDQQLRQALLKSGLALVDDRKGILVERIKSIIAEMTRTHEDSLKPNFSDYVADKMNYDYTYLANLFSEVTGITIEYFVIAHKVERVKELLVYEGLNLAEISYKLDYSSVAHLSSQFKKVTGLTPSFFRRMKRNRRESGTPTLVLAR